MAMLLKVSLVRHGDREASNIIICATQLTIMCASPSSKYHIIATDDYACYTTCT